MKNLLKATLVASTLATGSVFANTAGSEAQAAVDSFTSFFTANAALIGVAMLTAAFVAIGWKWLKGMAFN